MTLPRWTLASSLTILVASAGLSAAQNAPADAKPAIEQTTASLLVPAALVAPAKAGVTISRGMWDGLDTRPAADLMENAWDFTDPNGVPGFGPLPPTTESR